jgi:predicted GNAT superfamily acetyltransferase
MSERIPIIAIRDALESDFPRIVQLNEAEVRHTSKMDLNRLRHLDGLSAYHRVALVDGQIAAFLFAMRDGADYVNDNFNWFASRLSNYLYIDRIVVAAEFSGRRIGSAMYRDLFDFARSLTISHVVCEYNIEPPNLASRAFHDRWGFRELGSQWLDGGAKRVSLQSAEIN